LIAPYGAAFKILAPETVAGIFDVVKLQIIAPVEGKSWHIGHTILVDDGARFLVAIMKGRRAPQNYG